MHKHIHTCTQTCANVCASMYVCMYVAQVCRCTYVRVHVMCALITMCIRYRYVCVYVCVWMLIQGLDVWREDGREERNRPVGF